MHQTAGRCAPWQSTLVVCGLGLSLIGSAGAVPKPPPRFWSPARCERVMLTQHPAVSQVICVGSGGPTTCRWTSGHRARLYSELTVFTRLRQRNVAGAVATRRCSLVHARHTRATRLRPDRAPLRRPVRRVAGRLLPRPRQSARNRYESGKLPLDRRADCSPPEARGRDHRLHGQVAPGETSRTEASSRLERFD